ncbi:ABC-three component system middle component 8 [Spongiibacter thalassae]
MAFILLTRLKSKRTEQFDELLKHAKSRIKSADSLFLPALNFLYLMGTIEYHRKTDSFEYIEPVK